MPVPKKRAGSIDLRNQVADLLQIPVSTVFITGTKRMELRIWTEGMSPQEIARLRAFHMRVKTLALGFGVKRTSLSALHPREAQSVEDERRRGRGKARKERKESKEKK